MSVISRINEGQKLINKLAEARAEKLLKEYERESAAA